MSSRARWAKSKENSGPSKANWAIWEWGASDLQRKAARVQADAARRDQETLARQIEAELSASLAQGDAARGAVGTAEKAVASAEEAYRVTDAAVQAGLQLLLVHQRAVAGAAADHADAQFFHLRRRLGRGVGARRGSGKSARGGHGDQGSDRVGHRHRRAIMPSAPDRAA